jgi:hypothetical protein
MIIDQQAGGMGMLRLRCDSNRLRRLNDRRVGKDKTDRCALSLKLHGVGNIPIDKRSCSPAPIS